MKKLILPIIAIAIMSCEKEESVKPQSITQVQTQKNTVVAAENEQFIGVWTNVQSNTNLSSVNITAGATDSTIVIYGTINAVVTDSTFEGRFNQITHRGEIRENGQLYYCQDAGATRSCGLFEK